MKLEVRNIRLTGVVVCTLCLCALFGCKDKNKPDSRYGEVEKPSWNIPSDYDYTSSMTAIIRVDSMESSADDMLAAFSGEKCYGIAEYKDGLFYLYIAGGGESTVMLKLWSAHYKNIFVSSPIPYENDSQLGTVAALYVPVFTVSK